MKKCKVCKDKLLGEMVFYPTICLKCVIDLDNENPKKLQKYRK